MPDGVVVDAELVIRDQGGLPDFEPLTWRSRRARPISIEHGARVDPACTWVFDVLDRLGEDGRHPTSSRAKGDARAGATGSGFAK